VELINKAAHDSCTCVYSRRKYPAEDKENCICSSL